MNATVIFEPKWEMKVSTEDPAEAMRLPRLADLLKARNEQIEAAITAALAAEIERACTDVGLSWKANKRVCE